MIYKFKEFKDEPLLINHLNMGGKNPKGEEINVTSRYFTRNGKPWIGVMGEFRDAENLWDGPQFPMDAIDVNGRVALTIACSGIDARVARDVHKYSKNESRRYNYCFNVSVLDIPRRN